MEATASDMELAIAASYIDLSWQDGTSDEEVCAADEFARLTASRIRPDAEGQPCLTPISDNNTGE